MRTNLFKVTEFLGEYWSMEDFLYREFGLRFSFTQWVYDLAFVRVHVTHGARVDLKTNLPKKQTQISIENSRTKFCSFDWETLLATMKFKPTLWPSLVNVILWSGDNSTPFLNHFTSGTGLPRYGAARYAMEPSSAQASLRAWPNDGASSGMLAWAWSENYNTREFKWVTFPEPLSFAQHDDKPSIIKI